MFHFSSDTVKDLLGHWAKQYRVERRSNLYVGHGALLG
jgi:hypothetical protein